MTPSRLITATEILAASKPMRRMNREELREQNRRWDDPPRKCSTCGREKPASEFYTEGVHNGRQMYSYSCKPCVRTAMAIRRLHVR